MLVWHDNAISNYMDNFMLLLVGFMLLISIIVTVGPDDKHDKHDSKSKKPKRK